MNASAIRFVSFATACALSLAGLSGCASAPAGPPVDAPRLAVGDRWQYRVTDNLRRGAVSELDAEVVAVSGGSARVRLAVTDSSGRSESFDEIDGGALRAGSLWREPPRSFSPPAQLLPFPLSDGKTWRQSIDTLRGDTQLKDQILIYGRVDGRQTTSVPAGGFDAVYVYRIVQLDDEEFWRTRTTRRDAIWYAPEVKAPVRETREAEYTEKGGGPDMTTVRTESTLIELVSFRPGGK
ncbi:MAG TPA: hypothetical protein VF814_00750 [Casimicrobiaceae bacterium]